MAVFVKQYKNTDTDLLLNKNLIVPTQYNYSITRKINFNIINI